MMCSTGESGLVYKGYMDTPLGSELVAIKTGKGIKNCIQIFTDMYDCVILLHNIYVQHSFPLVTWND